MIYTKTEGGRQIFSDCRVIELDGLPFSNPTAEMIAAAGWVEWTPPPAPQEDEEPTEMDITEAVKRYLAKDIENLSDEDAMDIAALYPTWISRAKERKYIDLGERLWYAGELWKCINPHFAQEDWTPDTAVSLFVRVGLEEWPEIPETITAENPWMKGQKGVWKGVKKICALDYCVWNPDQLPSAWEDA